MLDMQVLADEIATIVAEEVRRATEPLIADRQALEQRLAAVEARAPERGECGERGEAGQRGEAGADGRDGALGEPGRDGIDGKNGADGRDGSDGKDGLDGADGLAGRDGIDGRDGRDGAGAAGALIERGGNLVLTMSDGRVCELGSVVGKDGRDGADGADGRDGSAGEAGRDGRDGRDGVDGLGFDDLTVERDGERGFVLRFARGEQTKTFPFQLPVLLDRGVYRAGQAYEEGDCVTFGGSLWIAQRATEEKPDGEDTGWRLGVKRGRDGRGAEQRA